MSVLYLTEQGAWLRKQGGRYVVTKDGRDLASVPLMRVDQVVVLGNIGLTTPAVRTLLSSGTDCVFCTADGQYRGRLISVDSRFGLLRQKQAHAANTPAIRLHMARELVMGKLQNQRALLLRWFRKRRDDTLREAADGVLTAIERVQQAATLNAVLAGEGYAALQYFRGFGACLAPEFGFGGRVRRPPTDPANSMLSLGYTLLTANLDSAVRVVGLDPYMGFLHSTQYARPSVALDLIEEFRPVLVDSLVLWMANTHAITPDGFQRAEDGRAVRMSERERGRFIEAFERRLTATIVHPRLHQRVTYRRCLELQARSLARVILGQDDQYRPFAVR